MDTVEALQERNARLTAELAEERRLRDRELHEHAKVVDLLNEKLALLLSRFYGRTTEKLSGDERIQMRLFDEVEAEAPETEATEQPAIEVPSHRRTPPHRRPLPDVLPRVERLIDIPEDQKRCGCGEPLVRIGEETSEKLDLIPPQVRVIRTIRPKYACHHCEGSGDEEKAAVRIAPMPKAIIDKGIATEGLLAHVVNAKFCDAIPLYRQETQFTRIGVDLSRQDMADWIIRVADASSPIAQLLLERVRAGPMLQIDETTVQVLQEEGRKNTTKSFMWVLHGGVPGARVILYHYAPSRSAEVAAQLLGDYRGFVQTDGYEAYDKVCARPGVVHVGCWAHARRTFSDARKVSSKAGSSEEALSLIAKLYAVEADRALIPDELEFAAHRRTQVEPTLQKLHPWLERKRGQVPPSSALGQAVGYTLGQWPKLIRYLDSAVMTPDTNACERAIRPFVIGRKNWLFSGSPRGAAASATFYSLIESAKANGLEPYWYLRKLFEGLPTATTPEKLLALAPFAPPAP